MFTNKFATMIDHKLIQLSAKVVNTIGDWYIVWKIDELAKMEDEDIVAPNMYRYTADPVGMGKMSCLCTLY